LLTDTCTKIELFLLFSLLWMSHTSYSSPSKVNCDHLWPHDLCPPAPIIVPYDGPVCDSRYCPSLPFSFPASPHSPRPYTSSPSNTETDQPSLVWFDRGKFYLTFEGKLGFISKDVARAHSSLIWLPPFSRIRSFIKSPWHLLCSVYLLCHLTVHLTITGSFSVSSRHHISSCVTNMSSGSCGSSALICSFRLWSWIIITHCFSFRCMALKLSVICFNFHSTSLPLFFPFIL